MKDGYRLLYEDYIVGPTNTLTSDPCPVGLSEMMTVARMSLAVLPHEQDQMEGTLVDFMPFGPARDLESEGGRRPVHQQLHNYIVITYVDK